MSASERRIAVLEAEIATLREHLSVARAEEGKLRHLLTQRLRAGHELEVGAIVASETGEPKVEITWDELGVQIPPAEARDLALQMIRVSEWAEQDATVYRMLKGDLGERAAAGFMAMMRESRGGSEDRSG